MEKRTLVILGWDLISAPQYTLWGKRGVMKIFNLEESRGGTCNQVIFLGGFYEEKTQAPPALTDFSGLAKITDVIVT